MVHHYRSRSQSHSPLFYLLAGIGAVVLGIFLVTSPVTTMRYLVQVLAVVWLVSGAGDIGRALFKRDEGWGWTLLGGFVSIVAGLVILGNPLLGAVFSVGTLFIFAAVAVIASGLANIFGGTERTKVRTSKRWTIGRFLLGVLQVACGVLILMHPLFGLVTLTLTLGFVAIVGGVLAALGAIFGLSKKDHD